MSSLVQKGRIQSATHRACSRSETDRTRPSALTDLQGNPLDQGGSHVGAFSITISKGHPYSAAATPQVSGGSLIEQTARLEPALSDARMWRTAIGRVNLHGRPTVRISRQESTPRRHLMIKRIHPVVLSFILLAGSSSSGRGADRRAAPKSGDVLTGHDALGDWTTDAPGVRRRITIDDLAKPFDTPSANNFPRVARRPAGAMPQAPKGFLVSEFATGLENPRKAVTAPNGDIFIAESMPGRAPGRIKVLRDADGDGKAELTEVFASGLRRPFGIAFYPAGAEPYLRIHRQHRLGGPIPVQER